MHNIFLISQFKHLLCYLCSIVDKILAHVIFFFLYIKKCPNIYRIQVVHAHNIILVH